MLLPAASLFMVAAGYVEQTEFVCLDKRVADLSLLCRNLAERMETLVSKLDCWEEQYGELACEVEDLRERLCEARDRLGLQTVFEHGRWANKGTTQVSAIMEESCTPPSLPKSNLANSYSFSW